jgi:hypothetical protein
MSSVIRTVSNQLKRNNMAGVFTVLARENFLGDDVVLAGDYKSHATQGFFDLSIVLTGVQNADSSAFCTPVVGNRFDESKRVKVGVNIGACDFSLV